MTSLYVLSFEPIMVHIFSTVHQALSYTQFISFCFEQQPNDTDHKFSANKTEASQMGTPSTANAGTQDPQKVQRINWEKKTTSGKTKNQWENKLRDRQINDSTEMVHISDQEKGVMNPNPKAYLIFRSTSSSLKNFVLRKSVITQRTLSFFNPII